MEAVVKAASADAAPPRAFVSGVEASAPGGAARHAKDCLVASGAVLPSACITGKPLGT